MELTPKQTEAVQLCTDTGKRLVGITGSAGTGKTTILKTAYMALIESIKIGDDEIVPVALCAPTGKAAKRISEATGLHASTIHRLLEFPKPGEIDPQTGKALQEGYPKRNKRFPLPFKVVFVDEAAMVSRDIFRFLLDALPTGGALRMFGDINQLPPIERSKADEAKPSPFKEVLTKFPSVTLDVVHRQAADSGILGNATRVLRGMPPMVRPDFKVIHTEQPVDTLLQVCKEIDFRSLDNQIISPTNKGWVGVHALNTRVQSICNARPDPNSWIRLPRHSWDEREGLNVAVGDKVVQTANNYAIDVMNGETGIVTGIDQISGSMFVDFGDKEVEIPPTLELEAGRGIYIDPRKDVDLAYVLTTHKCQGSEFKTVAYIMNRSRSFNLNRSNFYTAITRAKDNVVLISDLYCVRLSLAKQVAR